MKLFHLVLLAFTSAASGQVEIRGLCSGANFDVCLTVSQNPPEDDTPVRVAFFNNTIQQHWMLDLTSGVPPIRTAEDPNFCLDADLNLGTLHVSQCNDYSTTQGFHFVPSSSQIHLSNTAVLPEVLTTQDFCVTVGSGVEMCNDKTDPNQSWGLRPQEEQD